MASKIDDSVAVRQMVEITTELVIAGAAYGIRCVKVPERFREDVLVGCGFEGFTTEKTELQGPFNHALIILAS